MRDFAPLGIARDYFSADLQAAARRQTARLAAGPVKPVPRRPSAAAWEAKKDTPAVREARALLRRIQMTKELGR